MYRTAPSRVILPRMSVTPRPRNPVLEKRRLYSHTSQRPHGAVQCQGPEGSTVSGTTWTYTVSGTYGPTVSGTTGTYSVRAQRDLQCQGPEGPTVSGTARTRTVSGTRGTYSVRNHMDLHSVRDHRDLQSQGPEGPTASGTTETYSVRDLRPIRV